MIKKVSLVYLIFLIFWNCVSLDDKEKTDFDVKTSQIPGAGKGVYAKRFIAKDEYIGVYKGKFLTKAEYYELVKKDKWHYVMGLNECSAKYTPKGSLEIDGRDAGNVFTRINYAPEEFQNVKFEKLCEPPYVRVKAIKDIKEDEELYIDYGGYYIYDFMEYKEVKEFFENKRKEMGLEKK